MQGLWTRLFGRVKSHLRSVAQWIVKLLSLVPWKSAHSWWTKKWIYQGSRSGVECHPEVSLGHCFLKEQVLSLRTSTCFGYPLCLPFVDSMWMGNFTVNVMGYPNQYCPRDIRSYYWFETFPDRLITTKRKWRKFLVPPALIWFNRFWLSLVGASEGCNVSYCIKPEPLTGRSWRVVCSHPNTHLGWRLPFLPIEECLNVNYEPVE